MSNSAVFITNIPAPYREKVHNLVGVQLQGNYTVIYCSSIESNRKWSFKQAQYNHVFLTSKSIQFRGRTIYLTSNILQVLNNINPSVLIIGGFSMPMIVAYFWALVNRKKILSFTDANLDSEKSLTRIHYLIRKFFYNKSVACIGASKKSFELFKSYGVKTDRLFQSHLCANNDLFKNFYCSFESRYFDILLCGQMIPSKMFDFSLDVISELFKINSNLKVKILGSGPLRDHILKRLENIGVYYEYPGFVSQGESMNVHFLNDTLPSPASNTVSK